jgi:TRAP-type C4-dicarboxylate transport system permease small subunit
VSSKQAVNSSYTLISEGKMAIVYILLTISMLIVLVQSLTVLVLAIRLRKIEMESKETKDEGNGDDGILRKLALWLILLG